MKHQFRKSVNSEYMFHFSDCIPPAGEAKRQLCKCWPTTRSTSHKSIDFTANVAFVGCAFREGFMLRFGILGAGRIGNVHARAIASSGRA
ncbi:MAG TPA: inositol 2-dehydrogenase, partial [Pelagibacterium sp.]|nr:inositol 2-dehydrogenase [Pelagibacterium sp.]